MECEKTPRQRCKEERECNVICILIIAEVVMCVETSKQEKYNIGLTSQLNRKKNYR